MSQEKLAGLTAQASLELKLYGVDFSSAPQATARRTTRASLWGAPPVRVPLPKMGRRFTLEGTPQMI